ncbi:hypothetical protein EP47_04690 [Legionella norrlandica]|uniref:Uncharacterized protein n=1 Tax=Legionella norrlandica TaxID=1498499 RepID=A0A0A2SQQ8_9GAMM|nr:hypothetical protein [Legionella norrlandica]KGP63092.1 hypothetical protein EP47_04690 [Legionella norrlandica]
MQRLIWNFEFPTNRTIPLTTFSPYVRDKLKWEKRYFWFADQTIHLNNIDNALLDLANYQQKHKEDYYYLLPDSNYNIKQRRNQLLYKPLIKQSGSTLGFGPKINLDDPQYSLRHDNDFHIEREDLLKKVNTGGVAVLVKKEAFIFKFSTTPNIKLELARLEINNKVYFSACVEGRSLNLVENISTLLFGNQASGDYVAFLKSILKP